MEVSTTTARASEAVTNIEGHETAVLVFTMLIVLAPFIWRIIKWFWTHPRVNYDSVNRRIETLAKHRQTLIAEEQMIIDLEITNNDPEHFEYLKNFTIAWTPTQRTAEQSCPRMEIHLWTGDRKIRKLLVELANRNRQLTKEKILKNSWRMPKRHGREHQTTIWDNDL